MDKFIPHTDTLGLLLQEKAEHLFQLMHTIRVNELGLSEHGVLYFVGSHYKRLFFSIQTSAHILYNSITLSKKNVDEVVIMDYGAGIGSLYILAKMIGCKKVIYNDILEEWKQNALLIARAIEIDVDEYIVGDIDQTLEILNQKGITCDIITSRNVIEHIYQLDAFYTSIHLQQPSAIVYSSTTANFHNPAMNLQHVVHHTNTEKVYLKHRIDFIQAKYPSLKQNSVLQLAKRTKGFEKKGIQLAAQKFIESGVLPNPINIYTNTCEIEYGVWAENLIPFKMHRKYANKSGFDCAIQPGFWDTHYANKLVNSTTSIFNRIMQLIPSISFLLAPFIYVVAIPKQSNT